ncbi:helix-turn-helix transcriptional regulator [Novipirellula rosea]|uniref:helix-turn-helix domain-containing protein n=1 Tax=Novipirellula rosea TaxID=1031540 RepID=UPI0031E50996
MTSTQKVNDYPKLDIAKIRRIRKESGRTVAECSQSAGLPPQVWKLIESGKVRKIDVAAVVLIWQGLGCEAKAVMTEVRGKFTRVPTHVFVIDSDIRDAVLPMPSKRPPKRRRPASTISSSDLWQNTQPSLN